MCNYHLCFLYHHILLLSQIICQRHTGQSRSVNRRTYRIHYLSYFHPLDSCIDGKGIFIALVTLNHGIHFPLLFRECSIQTLAHTAFEQLLVFFQGLLFQIWIFRGNEQKLYVDFNSTSFSHPKSGSLSLANPDEGIRQFWIEHTKRCRAVAEAMGEAQGDPCIMNLWVHDGSKDITVNRMKYRELLKDSLDQIFATEYSHMKDCIESKVFGIGLESFTVGSNDFYIGYGVQHQKLITLDTGHFHPTESIGDKVSSLLLYVPELMLHVSRPIRWDSDHVTIMDDMTQELFSEIVRAGALDRVHYGLDYFDASINRIGAYVIGSRAAQKCMTRALLEPLAKLREYEANGQFFQRLALLEEAKSLPWNAVWDMFCLKNNVPVGETFIPEIEKYEAEVTSKR